MPELDRPARAEGPAGSRRFAQSCLRPAVKGTPQPQRGARLAVAAILLQVHSRGEWRRCVERHWRRPPRRAVCLFVPSSTVLPSRQRRSAVAVDRTSSFVIRLPSSVLAARRSPSSSSLCVSGRARRYAMMFSGMPCYGMWCYVDNGLPSAISVVSCCNEPLSAPQQARAPRSATQAPEGAGARDFLATREKPLEASL